MISSLDVHKQHHHSFFIEPSYKKWKKGGYGWIYYQESDQSVLKKIPRYEEEKSSSDNFYPSNATNKECIYYIYYPAVQEACFSCLLTNFYGFISLSSPIRLSPHYLYIHQKYLGDTLHHHISTIEIASVPYTFAELLKLCILMEKNGIQHTDLKTNNVLYDPDTNNLRIIDYNCMSVLTVQNQQLHWTDSIGSWMYVAPEISLESKVKDTSIVWTLGLILTQMLQCYPLQQQHYPEEITKTHILDRKEWIVAFKNLCLKEPEALFSKCFVHLPEPYKDVLAKIFVIDPSKRPSLMELYTLWNASFRLPYDIHMQQNYHEIVVTPFVGWMEEDRYYMVHNTYQFCRNWNETYKFCLMVHIIDHYASHITTKTLFHVIFAAWTIVSCLMNQHIQDNIDIYEYIRNAYHIECQEICTMMWVMCDTLQWNIYEKPYDVWLAQHGKTVNYDEIIERFIHQRTPYSIKTLFYEVA